MLTTIWNVLKNLPQFYVLLKEVVSFLSRFVDSYEKAQKLKDLNEAIKKAKNEKNTENLENLFKK